MAIQLDRAEAAIGWEGLRVHEMLDRSEQLFAQTGRYWGLERLELQTSDPIRYEKLFSRLRGGLVSARETALNISASPIVKEIGELCFMLYTPEGDSIALSTGIIVHVHTASDAIKYMVRRDYEDNPGIAAGDIFCNNDPMIGDVHNADVLTIVPIFWDRELVGWAAGVTHEIDIGASTPGGLPVGPISRYEDGLSFPAKKVGANDELFRDHVEAGKLGVRTPMYWTLDERTRLAGCHMARATVERVIREEGIDTYKQFIREVVEEGRRSFQKRVREMSFPGRYRSVAFNEVQFAEAERIPSYARMDTLMHAPTELRVDRDGVIEFDYSGSSSWGYHSFNCTPSAMQGAIWVQITQTLICHDKVNDGAQLGVRTILPPGTWTNHCNPQASSGVSWWFLIASFTTFIKSISRSFQARGFVEEVMAPYAFPSNVFQGGGIDHYGRPGATTNFGMSSVGVGAKMVLDGLDYGAAMWNPEGDMGDIESWEIIEPFLFLGQRVKANGGLGRHRGGAGYETLRLAWKTPFFEMQNIDHGKVFINSGLWGGYPGGAGYRHNVRDTNMLELIERGLPYPTHDGNPEESNVERMVTGRREFDQRTITLPEAMRHGDLYVCVYHGAHGLGDPIERPPASVQDDLNGGFLIPRLAESVYRCAISSDERGEWTVDPEQTAARREQFRSERGHTAVPVREWMAAERERILAHADGGGDFAEPVQRMYAESLRLSEPWAREFREFWDLPADFDFPVATPAVDMTRANLRRAAENEQ
ncbi:MAG TPA: hydantoinase B/oxoprolinase family protein [Solirubrobacteraceae bacterium]|nr:hydantoinase B/oxoprolinase family protein [Solirubrobacteraceae bacterium]